MLRSVHMAEGLIHYPVNDLNWVFGRLRQAQTDDTVHPLCVAFVADIVAVYTSCFAVFTLAAYRALH